MPDAGHRAARPPLRNSCGAMGMQFGQFTDPALSFSLVARDTRYVRWGASIQWSLSADAAAGSNRLRAASNRRQKGHQHACMSCCPPYPWPGGPAADRGSGRRDPGGPAEAITVGAAPAAVLTGSGVLDDVVAVTATNAWAVGHHGARGNSRTLVEHWNGTAWHRILVRPALGWLNGVDLRADNLFHKMQAVHTLFHKMQAVHTLHRAAAVLLLATVIRLEDLDIVPTEGHRHCPIFTVQTAFAGEIPAPCRSAGPAAVVA